MEKNWLTFKRKKDFLWQSQVKADIQKLEQALNGYKKSDKIAQNRSKISTQKINRTKEDFSL